jgi:phospholipid/cholesterol/gamma-HCH transport system substrate-binding protein
MRGVRRQVPAILSLVALVVVGVVVGAFIVGHQRLVVPAWVPLLGHDYYYLDAEFTAAPGVLPGQGNQVTISGIKVGEIDGVRLHDGRAVLRLRIDQRFGHVHRDARLLLRPKTGLKDMVVELDPGNRGPELRSDATLGTNATEPTVDLDQILASLDADTRDALITLVGNGATALGDGGGRDLASTFRRFEPLSRHTARATRLVAQRRVKLKRLMHNLSLLGQELGGRDRQLATFVQGSSAVFRRFARQNDAFAQTLELLPGALRQTDASVGKLAALAGTLKRDLPPLQPSAKALGPTLRDLRPFLEQTTPVLRDQLRPFAREAQPTARKLVPAAHGLAQATPDLKTLTDVLNALLDELAHDPAGNGPGGQSYLFYVPWANHNTNSALSAQDGISPIRRSLVLMSCGSLELLESIATPKRNPTLSTLIQLLNAPVRAQVCPSSGGGAGTTPAGGGGKGASG